MDTKAQVPAPGDLSLDHVSHFVPDIEAAADELTRLGFTLTPVSAQSHRLEPGGPLVPAGTSNRCIMLERGYLEFLTPTADTPLGTQLRTAIARYVGVHLIAFGTASPEGDHARLAREGFAPLPPVALQRPIETDRGEGTARFTVMRTAPGTMAEGRIQFVQHHTPELLWQARWVKHGNGVTTLSSAIVCVADPAEAALRYSRYTGLPVSEVGAAYRIRTSRGELVLVNAATLERALGLRAPRVPWIAGYGLISPDLDAFAAAASSAESELVQLTPERLLVRYPTSLGGIALIETPDAPAWT